MALSVRRVDRRGIGTGVLLAARVAGASVPVPAIAQSPADEPSRNLAVRLGLRSMGWTGGAGGVGLGGSWRSQRYVGLDGTIAYERFADEHDGASGELLARVFSGLGTHVASLGVGASLRHGRAYGPIGFLTGELAYELRPPHGLTLLLEAGVDIPVNDSGTATCAMPGFAVGCGQGWKGQYTSGEVIPRLRVAAGFAF